MYILECSDGSYYTGSTWHLEQRIDEHNGIPSIECIPDKDDELSKQGANYTRKRRPVKLVYFEEYKRIEDAFKREKQVQNWSHVKKTALMEGNLDKIHKLAICRNATRSPSVAEEPDIEKWASRLRSTSRLYPENERGKS
jgi:putative endonuclease